MSFDHNFRFWVATKHMLKNVLARQRYLEYTSPSKDRVVQYNVYANLYIMYVDLVNHMRYVYDNTYQVQKRPVIREIAETATRRLGEIKELLKTVELNEFVYADTHLIKKKLTPYELFVWKSPEFLYRRPTDIQNIFYENRLLNYENVVKDEQRERDKVVADIVEILQAHERARQARIYRGNIKFRKSVLKVIQRNRLSYRFQLDDKQPMREPVKRTFYQSRYLKKDPECEQYGDLANLDIYGQRERDWEMINRRRHAAINFIKAVYKAFREQGILEAKQEDRTSKMGLMRSPLKFKKDDKLKAIVETYKKEELKKKLDEDYVNLMLNEKVRLLQMREPFIMEDISDHIRAWFRYFYDTCDNFHPYPEEIKEGTVLVLIDESMNIPELMEYVKVKNMKKEERKKRNEKLKQQKQKEKEKLKKEKAKIAKKRKKQKAQGIMDFADEARNNKNMERMKKAFSQYHMDWKMVDEYLLKHHEPVKQWVTEDKLVEIHKELRAQVDEFMRIEHELLEKAMCQDKKQKYKPPKKKKPKKPKGKKGKKVSKDLTADRTMESLYEELKEAGIVQKFENKCYDDFVADFNFLAHDFRDQFGLVQMPPAVGDIKLIIQEALLGMGAFTVEKPKSMLLFGPLNSGKHLLTKIIASELDALVLNISPENIIQYEDDMNYFIHLIMKVAKAFQPTILLIDGAHRVFWKKVPPEAEELKPTLLSKYIKKKILKPIKKEDKVLLLGLSDAPWTAKASFKKMFQQIIQIPRSDYGTNYLIWLNELEKKLGTDNLFDHQLSALTKVMLNYFPGDIINDIDVTFDLARKFQLSTKPMNPQELLDTLLDVEPPNLPLDDKTADKYRKWFEGANKFAKQKKKFIKAKTKKKK